MKTNRAKFYDVGRVPPFNFESIEGKPVAIITPSPITPITWNQLQAAVTAKTPLEVVLSVLEPSARPTKLNLSVRLGGGACRASAKMRIASRVSCRENERSPFRLTWV